MRGVDLPELNGRTYLWIAWAGILVLTGSIPVLILIGQGIGALVMVPFTAAAIAFVPYESRLPTLFDALFAWASVLSAGGYAWDFYDTVGPYDGIVHLCTTFAVTLTFGYLAYDTVRGAFQEHPLLFLVAITSFGLAAGALWEMFEWVFGFIGSIPDTMSDLVLDGLGAFVAALLCVHARSFEPPPAPQRLREHGEWRKLPRLARD
jgi:hypothetical protein